MGEVGCLKDGHFQNLSCEGVFVLVGNVEHELTTGNFKITTGTLTVGGATTLSSTLAVTGATTLKKTINNDLNVAAAVNKTLTAADSGTIFNINGVLDNVITLPALSAGNLGVVYEFFIVVAVGSGTTTTVVLPGSAVSNFYSLNFLALGTAVNAVQDNAGDTFTFVNSTVAGARMRCTCVVDDATNSTWMCDSNGTPTSIVS